MRRGGPIARRTPLRAKTGLKRGAPIKTKAKPRKPADAAAHMARVALMACCVPSCRRPGPSTVHHVTGYADRPGRIARSDKRVVPLCCVHHQAGHDPFASAPVSVERLGHRGFFAAHGVDLLVLADELWVQSGGAITGSISP